MAACRMLGSADLPSRASTATSRSGIDKSHLFDYKMSPYTTTLANRALSQKAHQNARHDK